MRAPRYASTDSWGSRIAWRKASCTIVACLRVSSFRFAMASSRSWSPISTSSTGRKSANLWRSHQWPSRSSFTTSTHSATSIRFSLKSIAAWTKCKYVSLVPTSDAKVLSMVSMKFSTHFLYCSSLKLFMYESTGHGRISCWSWAAMSSLDSCCCGGGGGSKLLQLCKRFATFNCKTRCLEKQTHAQGWRKR